MNSSPCESRRRSSTWSAWYFCVNALVVYVAVPTSGLTSQKFVGSPAARPLARNVALPYKPLLALVEAKDRGRGLSGLRKPVKVVLVQFAPVYLLASPDCA